MANSIAFPPLQQTSKISICEIGTEEKLMKSKNSMFHAYTKRNIDKFNKRNHGKV